MNQRAVSWELRFIKGQAASGFWRGIGAFRWGLMTLGARSARLPAKVKNYSGLPRHLRGIASLAVQSIILSCGG